MVCFHSSILVDQNTDMNKSLNCADSRLKPRQINQFHKNKRISNTSDHLNIPACEQSIYAVIDVVILFAVIGACGFLFYPYARILAHKTVELGEEVVDVVTEEISRAPMVFGCLGLSILCAAMALVAIIEYADRRCGKPGCRGLKAAAEFDIQLETEETLRNSTCQEKSATDKGLFELPRDRHKDLEALLKSVAPPNGKAILIFRARCGCSVGKMEVSGPRKHRKVKK